MGGVLDKLIKQEDRVAHRADEEVREVETDEHQHHQRREAVPPDGVERRGEPLGILGHFDDEVFCAEVIVVENFDKLDSIADPVNLLFKVDTGFMEG